MAQALINHDLGPGIRAISAGTRPAPKVADGALEALRLAGISAEGLYPKDVDAVMAEPIDLVVTVCDSARETCPVFPRPIPALHMAFHDPHGESLDSFIRVRDEIRARLLPEIKKRVGAA